MDVRHFQDIFLFLRAFQFEGQNSSFHLLSLKRFRTIPHRGARHEKRTSCTLNRLFLIRSAEPNVAVRRLYLIHGYHGHRQRTAYSGVVHHPQKAAMQAGSEEIIDLRGLNAILPEVSCTRIISFLTYIRLIFWSIVSSGSCISWRPSCFLN